MEGRGSVDRKSVHAGDGGKLAIAERSCNQLHHVIIYQVMQEICLAAMTRSGPWHSDFSCSDVPLKSSSSSVAGGCVKENLFFKFH